MSVKNVRASKKISANHVAIDRLTSTIEDAYDEIIELRESIEEMTETMKKQQEILLTMAGTMKNLPEKETPKEKSTIKRECALSRDYQPNNKHTIPSMRVCSYCRRNVLKPINKNFNGYFCGVRLQELPLK
ncbi:hypothetical protein YC2023_022479 [Brassica napus]